MARPPLCFNVGVLFNRVDSFFCALEIGAGAVSVGLDGLELVRIPLCVPSFGLCLRDTGDFIKDLNHEEGNIVCQVTEL